MVRVSHDVFECPVFNFSPYEKKVGITNNKINFIIALIIQPQLIKISNANVTHIGVAIKNQSDFF